jgi:hypothetical protein
MNDPNRPWIMTVMVADKNQYGEYFVCIFSHKPTAEELEEMDFNEDDAFDLLTDGECGLLDGQGSRRYRLAQYEYAVDYAEKNLP